MEDRREEQHDRPGPDRNSVPIQATSDTLADAAAFLALRHDHGYRICRRSRAAVDSAIVTARSGESGASSRSGGARPRADVRAPEGA